MAKSKDSQKRPRSAHISTETLAESVKRSLPLEVELLRPYRYQVVLPKGIFDFLVLDLSVPPRKEGALRVWRRQFQEKHEIAVYIHRASSLANLRKEIEDIAQGVGLLSKKHLPAIEWRLGHFYGDVPRLNDLVRTLIPPAGLADLTDKPFIAIDEEGTADREDVVYAKCLRNRDIKLFVGFIDVSWFVRPETEVDLYAQRVALTQYGSRHTISTLGPDIAFGPGSFLLDEPRVAWIAELNVSPQGDIRNIRDPKVYRALVKAHFHLAPADVNKMLNGEKAKSASLKALADAASALRAHRAKAQKVIEIRGGGASGILVSECMIAANHAIAKYFLSPPVQKLGIHAIYKVHTPPSPSIKADLARKVCDLKIPARVADFDDPLKLALVLDQLEQLYTPEARALSAHILDIFLLRSSYDTINSGHHGVGMDAYSKFKPREAIGLFNAYQLDAIDNIQNGRNGARSHAPLSLDELNRRVRAGNRKLREHTNVNRRLRFFENLEERLHWVGQVFRGKVVELREDGSFHVDIPQFTKWGFVAAYNNGVAPSVGEELDVQLEGFSVERMRFQFTCM